MTQEVKTRKKLIEVALPLEAINVASAREKSIRHGHPSTLHLWWARRPLAAARAVIFSQLVDDPSSVPEEFPTIDEQNTERSRLFKIIEDMVLWENTTNEVVMERARKEIWRSWLRACADNKDHPEAKELFNPDVLPAFHDPFAGGGALPLEAQRLGLEAYASDLNPVAVLINKAMIEIPPKFAGKPPVNPEARKAMGYSGTWKGASGLAEDVRYYGKWMRDEAEKRIGPLYPKIEIIPEMARERPDLKQYVGQKLTVIAWIWARTVKSPNPAFADVDVPLTTTFMLSTKPGKEAYIEPVIEGKYCGFKVKIGKPADVEAEKSGTKLNGSNFRCLLSGIPISGDYIKSEGQAGRMGTRLMAVVAEGTRGRVYISPTLEMELAARQAKPTWKPEQALEGKSADQLPLYGMREYWQLFTPRQLVALTTFSDLVLEARELVKKDALDSGLSDDNKGLDSGGSGAAAYSGAVAMLLAFALDKQADLGNSLCRWEPIAQCPRQLFGRQAIPMVWDYAEGNPLGDSSGSWVVLVSGISSSFQKSFRISLSSARGYSYQADAANQVISNKKIVSTDPPYYNNVNYSDLSDFFYIWLRRTMKHILPALFATVATPKETELVASPYRHKNGKDAGEFFITGMTRAMQNLVDYSHPVCPVTIYYAFKQTETNNKIGLISTGWATFLEAVIQSGFTITGTWPIRTENSSRMISQGTNALASSIVIVCRKGEGKEIKTTKREFLEALKQELPIALANLQRGNIAPVDLQQAILGPGMAVYTRYSSIMDAEGNTVTVSEAISLILQILDEVLAEQEGDFDNDTRWALVWFEQFGFEEADYGTAEQLSKSKNTSVEGIQKAGIIKSGRGKVRLVKPSELRDDWDPETEKRITIWEIVHHLIRAVETGENEAAELIAKLGAKAEPSRELAYRLFNICERRNRSVDAARYNNLVQLWPDIYQKADEIKKSQPLQSRFDV
ncbi:MAG: DUF1156 domain-containing protein [Limnochordia bacterium]|nr:DUF1156 domain-containing protein [Limnochordia bacterium]